MRVSIGVSVSDGSDDPEALLHQADTQMYGVKAARLR